MACAMLTEDGNVIKMGVYSELGNARDFGSLGAIPKSDTAFKILQDDKYKDMGDISWSTGETWGVLISGCVVGVATVLLFNRMYR